MKKIDEFLNKITMYRLVLYCLTVFLAVAFILSFFKGLLPFSPTSLVFSTVFILAVSWIVNRIFAYVFEAPANVESVYITALILALIITPPAPSQYFSYLPFLFWVSTISMASKFIFAIERKHLFNPAAFAILITSLTLNHSASWWIGTSYMFPFVFIGGFLVIRKVRRFDMIFSFFLVSTAAFILGRTSGEPLSLLSMLYLNTSIFFFASIMLTEPLTTPPTKKLRALYGTLTAFLFVNPVLTPEMALLIGNIFSYIVSPKGKLILRLAERYNIAPATMDFVFDHEAEFDFKPGQYMEWTLDHEEPDDRGNRRYFTIASSPTEKRIRLGVKFYDDPSSYKGRMAYLMPGDKIIASHLAGDFVMPEEPDKKLVFIAGGIGVTPFRSMVQYLLDKREKRDIVMFYSNKNVSDIVYKDVFTTAFKEFGMKTIYSLTDIDNIPADWKGVRGGMKEEMINKMVPDFKERIFYISGPHGMVTMYEEMLKKIGVKSSQIMTDFFPGLV